MGGLRLLAGVREGNAFGNVNWAMLKNIELTAVMGSFYQYIHVAFRGSFACITVGLIVGALAERIRFSAVLIFVVVWLTLSISRLRIWSGAVVCWLPWRAGLCGWYRCASTPR